MNEGAVLTDPNAGADQGAGGNDPYSLGPAAPGLSEAPGHTGLGPGFDLEADGENEATGEAAAKTAEEDEATKAEADRLAAEEAAKKEAEEKAKAAPAEPTEEDLGRSFKLEFEDRDEDGELTKVAEDVSLSEMVDVYRAVRDNVHVYDAGREYQQIVQAIKESPEKAKQAIALFVKAAEETHAGKFDASNLDFGLLDQEGMTQVERALAAKLTTAEAALRQVAAGREQDRKEFQSKLDALAPSVQKAHAAETIERAIAIIQAEYGSAPTPEQLRTMQRETGSDDPVAAYKLASFDALAKNGPAGSPKMPKGGSTDKFYDPMDKSLTVDEIVRLRQQGYVARTAGR